jgi:hypothetical protein
MTQELSKPTPLGMIYLPASPGTPVGSFDFIVDPDHGQSIEIGTPVAADTEEGTLVGTVIDMRTIGTMRDPVSEELGNSYGTDPVASIREVMVATVQVFSSPLMRPARAGKVRGATGEEMLIATGYDRMDWAVPAGVVNLADGGFTKVCLDGKALLGPESAHMIVNGISGQAAKTSFAGVLMASALAAGGQEGNKVAVLVFNVKGDDLMHMDKSPTAGFELTADDLAMYDALGIPAEPFKDVQVWAPSLPGGTGSHSSRTDAQILRWDLKDVWNYLDYILPWMGDDEKAQSFMAEFEELMMRNAGPASRIDTFNKLDVWFDRAISTGDDKERPGSMGWGTHHVATLRRMRRMLMGVVARSGGLVSKEGSMSSNDVPVSGWQHGQVVVVDIAGLHTDVQGLVIGRTLRRLLDEAEKAGLGVDHLIVFFDELNSFAPNAGREMAQVKRILQRVATQGRYAGISLWGAAQQMSKVDELVRDNAATRAVGRTAETELSSGVYGRLSTGLTERLATIPQGSMALWHYSFRGSLVVKFPRPAWRTGKPKTGAIKKGIGDSLELSADALVRLSEGIDTDTRDRIIAEADNPELAIEKLQGARIPDMHKVVLHERSTVDVDNPFDI